MSKKSNADDIWWAGLPQLFFGSRFLCWNCQQNLGMEALKEALLGSEYRCKILVKKWEALVREIRDELVHNDPRSSGVKDRSLQGSNRAKAAEQKHTTKDSVESELTTTAEKDLLAKMARAVTRDHWKFGEWTAEWTQKFKRTRTDADLAKAINAIDADADVSRQYINDCRRVWLTFGATDKRVESLKFSHHLIALDNDAENAVKWLKKAEEKSWTTTELRRQIVSSLQATGTPADDALGGQVIRNVETDDETETPERKTGSTIRDIGTPEDSLPVADISGMFDGFIDRFEEALSDAVVEDQWDKTKLSQLRELAATAIKTLQTQLKAIDERLAEGSGV